MLQVANDNRGLCIKRLTRSVAISIPAGSFLRVPDDLVNAAGLVDVEWDGETIQIFAVDLRDRGELIQGYERNKWRKMTPEHTGRAKVTEPILLSSISQTSDLLGAHQSVILVADDEALIRNLVTLLLQR